MFQAFTNQGKRCLSDKKSWEFILRQLAPWKEWEMQTKKCKKCNSQMSLHLTAEPARAFQAREGKDRLPHLRGAASWSAGSMEKGNGDLG